MKICIDAREFVEDRITGITRYLEALLVPLISEKDITLILFVNDRNSVPQLLRDAVKCVKLPSAPTLAIDQIVLPKLTAKENTQIFFSPYYKVPLTGKFKRIITVHDIMPLKQTHEANVQTCKTKWRKNYFYGIQLKLACSKSNTILVDSEFTKKDLSGHLPAVSHKIKVLYPGLPLSWEETPSKKIIEETRRRYADNHPFLLYVGNFKPHKNVDLLVQSFIKAHEEGSMTNKRLLLAGGDPANISRIKSLVNSTRGKEFIRIHPSVPDAELKALYAAAEWFISTSEYEGFGYPLLEAMTCGCPIIYYPCASIPEITSNIPVMINELTINDIANSIRRAFAVSADERCNLIKQGRQKAERFLCNESTRTFRTIIESMT